MQYLRIAVVLLLALIAAPILAQPYPTDYGAFEIDDGSYDEYLSEGWYPPTPHVDFSGWSNSYTIDDSGDMSGLSCSVVDCTSNAGTNDRANLQCAIDAAPANSEIVFPANCVVDLFSGTLDIDRDDIVLRGPVRTDYGTKPTAGWRYDETWGKSGSSACNMVAGDKAPIKLCGAFSEGTTINKSDSTTLDGWTKGSTAIDDLASDPDVILNVGDWVLVHQLVDMSLDDPEWPDRGGSNPGGNVQDFYISHFAKVVSFPNSTSLTIGRPLRRDYDNNDRQMRIQAVNLGSNVLVKDLFVDATEAPWATPCAAGAQGDHPMIGFEGLGEGSGFDGVWVEGMCFQGLQVRASARTLVIRSVFIDNLAEDGTDTSAEGRPATYDTGAEDNHFVNNVVDNACPIMTQQTSNGNVIAYNYNFGCNYRGGFLHGDRPFENLWEANHFGEALTNASHAAGSWRGIEIDREWGGSTSYGSNGPRNAWFRNRLSDTMHCNSGSAFVDPPVKCADDDDCSGAEVCVPTSKSGIGFHQETNISIETPVFIANIGGGLSQGNVGNRYPGSTPFDDVCSTCTAGVDRTILGGAYTERNVWQGADFSTEPPVADRSVDNNNSIPANYYGSQNGDYLDGVRAPAGWSSFGSAPDSFFLASVPEWWCEETCDWELASGIGAFGDSLEPAQVSPHRPTMCQIPAERWYTNQTCTALSAGGTSTLSGGSLTGGSIQ